jgi:hypothetical protein
MRIALMQPYFFPYIGYFQLMAACDLFVVHDDVQYVKEGWVNRNRILVNGAAGWITLPVKAAAHDLRISEREYLLHDRSTLRMPARIAGVYRGAPYLQRTMPLVEEILSFPESSVAAFNTNLLRRVAAHVDIVTPITLSSQLVKDDALGGEERVLNICQRLDASSYVNAIGGRALYSRRAFSQRHIELMFLSCEATPYRQFGSGHVPLLSVLDALMFNDLPDVKRMLSEYRLLPGSEAQDASGN